MTMLITACGSPTPLSSSSKLLLTRLHVILLLNLFPQLPLALSYLYQPVALLKGPHELP